MVSDSPTRIATLEKSKLEYAITDGTSSAEVGSDETLLNDAVKKITKISSTITVLVAGLALFSDGYNAQIIGYIEPLFTDLYKDGILSSIKIRLSNTNLISEIFSMLFFRFLINKIG